jgi:hypothetical protein
MKRTALLIAVCVLPACARVAVTHANYQNRTFTVCGNKFAGGDDLNGKASEYCQGNPVALQCGTQQYGTYTQFYGNAAYSVPQYGTCCEYECR